MISVMVRELVSNPEVRVEPPIRMIVAYEDDELLEATVAFLWYVQTSTPSEFKVTKFGAPKTSTTSVWVVTSFFSVI